MNEQLKFKGGARIGCMNATAPFATLTVDQTTLSLDVGFLGYFEFQPDDIISIEKYSLIPIIGQGIRINHRSKKYKSKIIFWSIMDPDKLINNIKQTGFLNDAKENISKEDLDLLRLQRQKEFPINPFVIAILLLFSLGLLMNSTSFFPLKSGGNEIFIRTVILFCSVFFIFLLLLLLSPMIQKLTLIKGSTIGEIKKTVIWITSLLGLVLFCLIFFLVF